MFVRSALCHLRRRSWQCCGGSSVRSASTVKNNDEQLHDGRHSRPTASAVAAAAAAGGSDDGDHGGGFSFVQPEFDNTRLIYANKTTGELLRAYLVFGLCSFDVLVDYQTQVPPPSPFLVAIS